MTLSAESLWLYAGALVVLWITPGPVFIAITARALSGGFRSAWPLAVGVTIGDILWPLTAIFGLSWVLARFDSLMTVMHWVAAAMFLAMGALLLRHAGQSPVGAEGGRLTRPGLWPAFSAGVAAVLGNPKAILFYMGLLPGFFDLSRVTAPDVGVILLLSASIPFAGNLLTAYAVGQARRLLSSPRALWWVNVVAGLLMLLVGVVIALS